MADYFRDIKPTYWIALIRQNGTLEIFSVVDGVVTESFQTAQVHMGHRLLTSIKLDEPPNPLHSSTNCGVVEIGIFGLGHLYRRPLMMVRNSDFGVLIYEAIPAFVKRDNQLNIRFRKLNHNLLLRETKT